MVSAVPVSPNVRPPLLSQGGAIQPVEATNQNPKAQTPVPTLSVDQPQSAVPQQQSPHQFLPPLQHYTWSPIGGGALIVPLQPSVQGSQPTSQPTLPQPALVFPPYGYFPLFSSPYGNQPFSPYGFLINREAPIPQTPANQPLNTQVSLGETPSRPVPSADPPQPVQQQQNPQIVHMLQQPMNSALGSLSSEELEMAAKLGQLGAYLQMVLTNPPAGAIQEPVSQAAGLTNRGQPEALPAEGTSSPGVQQTQRLRQRSGTMAIGVPVGLEKPAQEVVTVQTPAQPKLKPTQGNLL
ncbi:proline-rich receptor-like protein kinase PERK8 [Thunnus albacares]|uniref:proline-rich receptor-like protein kinase PERK8 n=1 Tax=Thunnus albacares TaxID=8236 RepID=UPI001CF645A6|nr:proline-rich receptor-like protein kinase PERK8 [Thunnus albacares]